jgi:hypothetical protein
VIPAHQSASMATLALKPAENFLLVAFIIATNLVIFFNLTSGPIFGEYYREYYILLLNLPGNPVRGRMRFSSAIIASPRRLTKNIWGNTIIIILNNKC